MPAEPRRRNAREAESLELGYLAKVLSQLERRAADCEQLLAEAQQEPPEAVASDERRLLRRRADAAVLRSQLARVEVAISLVRSYTELRRQELEQLHESPTEKSTTTMEVP